MSESTRKDPASRHGESLSSSSQEEEEALVARELERRVIYAMLLPGVRLSRMFDVGLKEVGEWTELAYLKELMHDGIKFKDAADLLGVSVRKVSQLASKMRENFFTPEFEHELPARIEFMLWASPLSRKRIRQYLQQLDEEIVDEAIDTLLEQGRIQEVAGRTTTFEVVQSEQRLVRDDIMARIDALNTLLGQVTDAVFGRFFRQEQKAFARSLQFRIRAEDLPRLRQLYEESVWKTLSELDEAAREDPHAIPMGATLCWAPMDLTLDVLANKMAREVLDGADAAREGGADDEEDLH